MVATANTPPAQAGTRVARVWLHSATADLAVLLVPLAAIAVFVGLEIHRGSDGVLERGYAGWASQFVLLNTSHVLLTFLLLGKRRDVLDAAPGQRALVVKGSLAAFAASFALFWTTQFAFPAWADFAYAIAYIFATHHRLSQTKGVWSLYNIVGHKHGLPRPGPREVSLQKVIVPIGLILVSVRVLFIPASRSFHIPVVPAVPHMDAPLPHAATYGLLAAWVVLLGAIALSLRGAFRISGKPVYVLLYGLYFAVLIYSPIWGSALIGGVHGLEYLLLTDRMLKDDGAASHRFARWTTLFVAMLPALMVGLLTAPVPFSLHLTGTPALVLIYAQIALGSAVMTHYFTDGVIYRFRIPSVRATMLRRLQLSN